MSYATSSPTVSSIAKAVGIAILMLLNPTAIAAAEATRRFSGDGADAVDLQSMSRLSDAAQQSIIQPQGWHDIAKQPTEDSICRSDTSADTTKIALNETIERAKLLIVHTKAMIRDHSIFGVASEALGIAKDILAKLKDHEEEGRNLVKNLKDLSEKKPQDLPAIDAIHKAMLTLREALIATQAQYQTEALRLIEQRDKRRGVFNFATHTAPTLDFLGLQKEVLTKALKDLNLDATISDAELAESQSKINTALAKIEEYIRFLAAPQPDPEKDQMLSRAVEISIENCKPILAKLNDDGTSSTTQFSIISPASEAKAEAEATESAPFYSEARFFKEINANPAYEKAASTSPNFEAFKLRILKKAPDHIENINNFSKILVEHQKRIDGLSKLLEKSSAGKAFYEKMQQAIQLAQQFVIFSQQFYQQLLSIVKDAPETLILKHNKQWQLIQKEFSRLSQEMQDLSAELPTHIPLDHRISSTLLDWRAHWRAVTENPWTPLLLLPAVGYVLRKFFPGQNPVGMGPRITRGSRGEVVAVNAMEGTVFRRYTAGGAVQHKDAQTPTPKAVPVQSAKTNAPVQLKTQEENAFEEAYKTNQAKFKAMEAHLEKRRAVYQKSLLKDAKTLLNVLNAVKKTERNHQHIAKILAIQITLATPVLTEEKLKESEKEMHEIRTDIARKQQLQPNIACTEAAAAVAFTDAPPETASSDDEKASEIGTDDDEKVERVAVAARAAGAPSPVLEPAFITPFAAAAASTLSKAMFGATGIAPTGELAEAMATRSYLESGVPLAARSSVGTAANIEQFYTGLITFFQKYPLTATDNLHGVKKTARHQVAHHQCALERAQSGVLQLLFSEEGLSQAQWFSEYFSALQIKPAADQLNQMIGRRMVLLKHFSEKYRSDTDRNSTRSLTVLLGLMWDIASIFTENAISTPLAFCNEMTTVRNALSHITTITTDTGPQLTTSGITIPDILGIVGNLVEAAGTYRSIWNDYQATLSVDEQSRWARVLAPSPTMTVSDAAAASSRYIDRGLGFLFPE